jgi:hypothetical protein
MMILSLGGKSGNGKYQPYGIIKMKGESLSVNT